MTDKAQKRRRELAAKLNVSNRTAANIIRARTTESRVANQPAHEPVSLGINARVPRVGRVRALPHVRHVHLEQPTRHAIDVFIVNQRIAHFIAKFAKKGTGWSFSEHYLAPVAARATWAEEDERRAALGAEEPIVADEEKLRAFAVKALEDVRPGFMLAVHSPGRLALMWSDHPVPRDGFEKFGPPLQAVPRQEIIDGPAPAWWPKRPADEPAVRVHEQISEGGIRVFAQCTSCAAATHFDALVSHPTVIDMSWPMLCGNIEAQFGTHSFDLSGLREDLRREIEAITKNLVPTWTDELRHYGCRHV